MGRWANYMDRMGVDLSRYYNEIIRGALRKGVEVVVTETHQDSGRAAFHWILLPMNGGALGSQRVLREYNPDVRGVPPVGVQGTAGQNAPAVRATVIRREDKVIMQFVAGVARTSSFLLYNAVLAGDDYYAGHALLEAARAEAQAAMHEFIHERMAARGGNIFRKRPF